MASAKQIEANRRNAKNSSGPKTPGGKSITKLNALKHGLCAEQTTIPGEEPKDFDALRQRLVREVCPQDLIEEQLVDWIAISMWRMKRGAAFEAALFTYLRGQKGYKKESAELENRDSGPKNAEIQSILSEFDDAHLRALKKLCEIRDESESEEADLGRAFEKGETTLTNVMRYQCAAERSLCGALRELDRRQAKRQERGPNSISDKEEKLDAVITLPSKRL